jgi:hypothetical protein
VKKEMVKKFEVGGLVVEDLKPVIKEQLELAGGAVIKSVDGQNWKEAGAKNGFVITSIISNDGRIKIKNAENLVDVLEEKKGEEIVVLGMFQDGTEYYFEVKLK